MSHKRRGQDGRNQHAGGKRSRWNRQHLHLVLDDWDEGFSIHKIDADSFDDSDSGDDQQHAAGSFDSGSDDNNQQGEGVVARHLPDPPALRLESPPDGRHEAHTGMTFAAMGTKIFVFMNQRCGLVYDTDTAALAMGAHAPPRMACGSGISVAAGEVLYLLTYRFFDSEGQHSFEAMSWASTAPDEMRRRRRRPTEAWCWKTMPAPPPTFTSRQRVISHALHPDECTIFMTTANRDTPDAPLGTYSFSTKEATWMWHGECALPFLGQGHFDTELEAWIGLGRDGYICACQAVSPNFVSAQPLGKHSGYIDPNIYLDCQTTKEKLFCKEPQRHMGASLTSMGSGRFCLVECVESEKEKPTFGDSDGCVLHVTIFGLKYNHKGELKTTNHRSTRSFIVSRHRDHFVPFAFWM